MLYIIYKQYFLLEKKVQSWNKLSVDIRLNCNLCFLQALLLLASSYSAKSVL